MSDSIDKILDTIDAGLQSSPEIGYGHTDTSRNFCARCQLNEPVEGGDLCIGCRRFLLGDSDEDPKTVRPKPDFSTGIVLTAAEVAGMSPLPVERVVRDHLLRRCHYHLLGNPAFGRAYDEFRRRYGGVRGEITQFVMRHTDISSRQEGMRVIVTADLFWRDGLAEEQRRYEWRNRQYEIIRGDDEHTERR